MAPRCRRRRSGRRAPALPHHPPPLDEVQYGSALRTDPGPRNLGATQTPLPAAFSPAHRCVRWRTKRPGRSHSIMDSVAAGMIFAPGGMFIRSRRHEYSHVRACLRHRVPARRRQRLSFENAASGSCRRTAAFGGHGLWARHGLLPVNLLHNLVHVLFGILGVVAFAGFRAACLRADRGGRLRPAGRSGTAPATSTLFGLVPIYGNDVWLHLVLGVVAAYFGFMAPAADPVQPK